MQAPETTHAPGASRLREAYCFTLCFMGGFHVMLLEMCAFRVLQTTFGSSIYVTGILLTLVMLALSLGYLLGGRLSERTRSLGALFSVLLAVMLYVNLFDVLLADRILDWSFGLRRAFTSKVAVNALPPGLVTLLLYVLPMVGLSQVSPFLIKVIVSSQAAGAREAVGLTSGKLMAMSTYGSIAGTLLATFVLIPYLGVRSTLALFSVSTLVMVAGGVFLFAEASRGRLVMLGLSAASLAFFLLAEERKAEDLIAETESAYGTIQVLRSVDEEGDESRIFKPSRVYMHSEVFLDKPLKDQMGLAYFAPGLASGARSYLVLGVAGGGALLQLKTVMPEASITGVELDPEALRIAREHFKMPTGEGVTLAVDDARVYLRTTQQQFDYIIVDLFSGEHIPAHCVGQEFFSLVKRRLAPGGIMFVNTNMAEVHVATSLSVPVDAPLPHLHSAIFNAGFASVFQNDLFNAGFLYAFTEPVSHAAFQERLRAAARDEKLDVNLRASMAATALISVPVPAERRQVRPFTDQWSPEPLVQEKTRYRAYLESLIEQARAPGWGQEAPERLVLLSARHIARHHERTSQLGVEPEAYCGDVARWLETSQAPLTELGRYFMSDACEEQLSAERGGPSEQARLRALRAYVTGLKWARENRGHRALPLLLEAMNHLG